MQKINWMPLSNSKNTFHFLCNFLHFGSSVITRECTSLDRSHIWYICRGKANRNISVTWGQAVISWENRNSVYFLPISLVISSSSHVQLHFPMHISVLWPLEAHGRCEKLIYQLLKPMHFDHSLLCIGIEIALSAENVVKYWSGTCKRKMELNSGNTLHQLRTLRAKEQQ